MKVEVIDSKTYVVNEKVFEIGSEIQMSDSLGMRLAEIRALDTELKSLRQEAVTETHLAQSNYSAKISSIAHLLNGKSIRYAYLTSSFANDLYAHVGGLLPFMFNEDKTKIVVRERTRISESDYEDVNYTVASVKRMLGMTRMEDQRLLAVKLAGSADKVTIDTSKNSEYQFQPLTMSTEASMLSIVDAVRDLMALKRNPADTLLLYHGAEIKGVSVLRVINDGNRARMEGIQRYAKDMKVGGVVIILRKGATVLVSTTSILDKTGMTYRIEDPAKPPVETKTYEGGAEWAALLAASNGASK